MAGGWIMPPLYALGQDLAAVTSGASQGTTITSGAANTKGSWIQLIASTANDISRLWVYLDMYNAGGSAFAFDLAAASSGNESSGLIIQNLMCTGNSGQAQIFEVAVNIKSGTRVAARCASSNATDTPNMQVIGYDTGYTDTIRCDSYDTYGYSGTGTITGVSVDPGATANTKGAYSQITSSTTNDLIGMFMMFDQNSNATGAAGSSFNGHMLFDIAMGAAASEVVIIPNLPFSKNMFGGGDTIGPLYTPVFYKAIKAGTRLAVRAQSANTDASARLMSISIVGLRG